MSSVGECTVKTVGVGALVVSSVLGELRVVLLVLPHCVRSARFDSAKSRNRWWFVHKRLALVHYVFLAQLFELLLVWGWALAPDTLQPVAADVMLGWMAVQVATIVLLVVSCSVRRHYRGLVMAAQVMELACMAVFVCERAVNTNSAGQITVSGMLLVCNVFEVFSAPDFFNGFFPLRTPDGRANNEDADDDRSRAMSGRTNDGGGAPADRSILDDDAAEDVRSEDEGMRERGRDLVALYDFIQQCNPSVMSVVHLREFIEQCKKRVDRLTHGVRVDDLFESSGASKRSVAGGEKHSASSSRMSEYGPIAFPAEVSATAAGGGGGASAMGSANSSNSGLASRYKRERAVSSIEFEEC